MTWMIQKNIYIPFDFVTRGGGQEGGLERTASVIISAEADVADDVASGDEALANDAASTDCLIKTIRRAHGGQSAEEPVDFSSSLHRWHEEQQGSAGAPNDAEALYLLQSDPRPRTDAPRRRTIRGRGVRQEGTIGSKFSCHTGECSSFLSTWVRRVWNLCLDQIHPESRCFFKILDYCGKTWCRWEHRKGL